MKLLSYEWQTLEGGREVRSGFFGYGINVAETLKSPEIAINFPLYRTEMEVRVWKWGLSAAYSRAHCQPYVLSSSLRRRFRYM